MNTRFCIFKAAVIAAAMILGSSEATSAVLLPAFVNDAVPTDTDQSNTDQTSIVEACVDDTDSATCDDSPEVDLISPLLAMPAQHLLSPALLVDALDEFSDEIAEESAEGEAVEAVPEPTSLGLIALGGLLSVMVAARYRMG